MPRQTVGRARWTLLAALILACMAFYVAWRRTSMSSWSRGSVTVSVEPFHITGTVADSALAASVAEAIRRALDTLPGFRAPARQGPGAGHFEYTLRGVLNRMPERSEVGLELTRVGQRAAAWTGTYWRVPADVPTFGAEIASAVAESIRGDSARSRRSR